VAGVGVSFNDSRDGRCQRHDKDLLYIAPMRFTSSVLKRGLMGFPSVSKTLTVPKL